MNSMNARLKGFGLGGSKRKSAANNALPQQAGVNTSSPQLIGRPATLTASSSTASLPQMNPGAGGRPPSYTQGYQPGPGAPGQLGNRTTSPQMAVNPRTPPSQVMGGPPPINTGAGGQYPPQQQQHHPVPMGGQPMQQGGPPGPPQYGQPAGYQQQGAPMGGPPAPYVARNNAVEVEGAGKSKSQLIVGIDFVSRFSSSGGAAVLTSTGYHLLWCRLCIRI
jgi:hypothetical protein